MLFTQPSNISPVEYAKALWNKGLRGDMLYDESVLIGILSEGLSKYICCSTCPYWRSKNNATVHDLARHASSKAKLQNGSWNTDATHLYDMTDISRENDVQRKGNVNHINLNLLLSIR